MYDTSRFHTDGYRDHSTVTRDLYNAKFKMPAGNGQLTFVLNSIDQPETQDPLGLNRTQLSQNARQADPSALLFNTRASEREIVDLVTKTAADYDVPIGADDVSVQVVGSDVTVDMPYTEHVVLVPGVYAIDWTFTPTTTIRRLQGVGR